MTRAGIGRLWIIAALLACGQPEPAPSPAPGSSGAATADPRPNLLLVSVDTLRADHLGAYGYARSTSPHIDALAARGVVFERVMSTSSWTLPSHASMLTGLYPARHGLQDDGVALAPGIPTLAETLQRSGYFTVATVSHVYVSDAFGLGRGFDVFDDRLTRGGTRNPVASKVVDRFLEQMEEAPEGPWFGFVHFFDPHWSYRPPPPFDEKFTDPHYDGMIDGRYASMKRFLPEGSPMTVRDRLQLVARYDGEVAYLDAQLGRMLDALREAGRLENTVVVLTGDHGEEFKEHGSLGHGATLYAEQLAVPLLIAGHPAFPPGTRRSDPASPVDLAPTLLELAGAEAAAPLDGRSLLAAGSGEERALFAESIRFGIELRAVQQGDLKLIHRPQTGRGEFFDLASDPREQRPLDEDPSGGRLTAALADYAASADAGWHLKILGVGPAPVRVRGRIRSPARLVDPQRYFSQKIAGSVAELRRFELSPDGHELELDVVVGSHMGEITFETEPPDAPVSFELAVESDAPGAGVFLGAGGAAQAAPLRLERSDPRLRGHADYQHSAPGAYIRAVPAPVDVPRATLSAEAIENLKALGYLDPPAESVSEEAAGEGQQ